MLLFLILLKQRWSLLGPCQGHQARQLACYDARVTWSNVWVDLKAWPKQQPNQANVKLAVTCLRFMVQECSGWYRLSCRQCSFSFCSLVYISNRAPRRYTSRKLLDVTWPSVVFEWWIFSSEADGQACHQHACLCRLLYRILGFCKISGKHGMTWETRACLRHYLQMSHTTNHYSLHNITHSMREQWTCVYRIAVSSSVEPLINAPFNGRSP